MKIGIFGGTFNPVHYGHLRAAQEVQESFSFDRLLLMPSGKPHFKKPLLARARHRFEMVKTAVNGSYYLGISDIEIKTRGISYSVESMSKLVKRHKNAEFYFILGIDTFLELHKWKQPLKFMKLTNFIVLSRPGYAFSELSSSPYFFNINKKTLKVFDSDSRKRCSFSLKSGKKAFLLKITGLDISASYIRKLVRSGRSIKYLLPDSVESYIISHKLYK